MWYISHKRPFFCVKWPFNKSQSVSRKCKRKMIASSIQKHFFDRVNSLRNLFFFFFLKEVLELFYFCISKMDCNWFQMLNPPGFLETWKGWKKEQTFTQTAEIWNQRHPHLKSLNNKHKINVILGLQEAVSKNNNCNFSCSLWGTGTSLNGKSEVLVKIG